jgi:hypothetical protein
MSKRAPEYGTWWGMVQRCTYPRHNRFALYGGRGIAVCDRWRYGDGERSGFECFFADMGPRPERHSIDRVDNDGNYEPGNCRWATASVQMRNRRPFKLTASQVAEIRALAGQLSQAKIARRFGIARATVGDILTERTWRKVEADLAFSAEATSAELTPAGG